MIENGESDLNSRLDPGSHRTVHIQKDFYPKCINRICLLLLVVLLFLMCFYCCFCCCCCCCYYYCCCLCIISEVGIL